jgi:transposase
VPRNRGANTTVLSSMSAKGMGSSLTVEGATTSAVFEAYVEQVLAPTPRKGQVVVMDNLSAHKEGRKGTPADRRARMRAHLLAVLLSGL